MLLTRLSSQLFSRIKSRLLQRYCIPRVFHVNINAMLIFSDICNLQTQSQHVPSTYSKSLFPLQSSSTIISPSTTIISLFSSSTETPIVSTYNHYASLQIFISLPPLSTFPLTKPSYVLPRKQLVNRIQLQSKSLVIIQRMYRIMTRSTDRGSSGGHFCAGKDVAFEESAVG